MTKHIAGTHTCVKGIIWFIDAAEQYLLSGNGGSYLEPILKQIGLKKICEIDQALMLQLAKNCTRTAPRPL